MSEPQRYFTLEEANRTLPLVRRIAQDIVAAYPTFREKLEALQLLGESDDPQRKRKMRALRTEIDREADRINGFLRELQEIGCLFKGFDLGLVDFYSHHEGKPVLLCWKLGEDRITHWHGVDEGYAGRKPLAASESTSFGN